MGDMRRRLLLRSRVNRVVRATDALRGKPHFSMLTALCLAYPKSLHTSTSVDNIAAAARLIKL